jgi:DNA-binding MarR family transcriptional regulator
MLESFVQAGHVGIGAGQVASAPMLFRSPERSYAAPPQELNTRGAARISAEQVRALLRARRLRDQVLAQDLFADPAWDILLDLMAAHLEGNKVSVSSLCIAAAVPPTTALRWIQQLTDRGLLERRADPLDGRRIFITLSEVGLSAVQSWFDASRPLLLNAAG